MTKRVKCLVGTSWDGFLKEGEIYEVERELDNDLSPTGKVYVISDVEGYPLYFFTDRFEVVE